MPRKTTKKTKKITKVAAPACEAHTCHCGDACKCGCGCGKFTKLVVLFIVFLLGFAVAKITCCRGGRQMYKPSMQDKHPIFVNGCLDMESVANKTMREALQNSEASADGCVTIAEYKSVKAGLKK